MTLAIVALLTRASLLSLRMRPGALVPIKWRVAEWTRWVLPLAVNLKRFLAQRWVFNFNFGFDAFLGIAGNPLLNSFCHTISCPTLQPNYHSEERFLTSLRSVRNDGEGKRCGLLRPRTAGYCDCWALDDVCPAGLATLTPFFGASKATRTLPSMRGMVSIWPWSPISISKRFILARPTSWCAISRPRWKIMARTLWPSPRNRMIWLLRT